MALLDLFLRPSRKSDARQEEAAPIDKPTTIQRLFGGGDYMRELGAQRKRVQKEYFSQLRDYRDDRRLRDKQYKKDELERRKQFWGRRVGRWDLVDRDLNAEELQDRRLKKWSEKYEEMEDEVRRQFRKSERAGEEQLKKNFHSQLQETSSNLRQRTTRSRQSQGRFVTSKVRKDRLSA